MGADIRIREGGEADTGAALDLIRSSMGEGDIPRSREYWEWKHRQNPFGPSPMLLAEVDGAVVGLRVFMRWEWSNRGTVLRSVRAVDTATHPDWQGKRIFSRLTMGLVERMSEEGVSFVFNTPNDKSRPGYFKMGWQAVGRADLWIKPLRPLRLAALIVSRVRRRPMAAHSAELVPSDLAPIGDLLSAGELHPFLSSASAADADGRLATPRTAEYLRWRYRAIPAFEYRAAFDLDGVNGAAVVVREKRTAGLHELRVCELLVGEGKDGTRAARDVLRQVQKNSGADYISAMAPRGSRQSSVLIRAGFLPAPRLGPILTVRLLAGLPAGSPDPRERSSWRLSTGDLELF